MGRATAVILLVTVAFHCATADTCDPSAARSDCGYLGINEAQCEDKGCCWSPADNQPWCFFRNSPSPGGTCQPNAPRTDCGFVGINQTGCEDKGCCWSPKEGDAWCFYKTSNAQYIVDTVTDTTLGVTLTLKYNGSGDSTPYGPDITPLQVEIEAQTDDRLHVKILDPNNKRWEIPTYISPAPSPPSSPPTSPQYKYDIPKVGEPFNIAVIRVSDGSTVFNTSQYGVLRFVDQYLSIGTALPNNYFLYGLGEHVLSSFRLSPNQMLTLFNIDTGTPVGPNLYGSHPFYLEIRPPSSSSSSPSSSHGVYLRNSNGMDISLTSTSLNYRVIGGVLDFYFFLGPQPEAVVQQYQEVIGRPHMPPYWGLGFHNCRYGYPNVETLEAVVTNYSNAQIPLETMWTDIDYMDQYKDFTLDPVNFPSDKMNQFVDQLHNNGQHYVVIIDPGMKNEQGYPPYDDGVATKSFIMDKNGNVFIGKVWPGTTAFPDFLKNSTLDYWKSQISTFLQLLPVDGLWIDMNEISNFCNGECFSDDEYPIPYLSLPKSAIRTRLRRHGTETRRVGFNPDSPPYAINNFNSKAALNTKTVDMDATHLDGAVLEYNAHNLYGLSEARATSRALESVKGTRSFVISRSTFPGSGIHTGHWTGDNHSSASDLLNSIFGMLSFQLFGIPLIGSDICGFIGNTNPQLCSRWIELGAFYPFSRDHNTKGAESQELYRWPEVAAISRKVLAIRYSLLPYYYTLFYKAHTPVTPSAAPAATVVRPLFFEFPNDTQTYDIDQQFMLGPGILISPVTDETSTSKTVYFPRAKWYDWYSHAVITATGGTSQTLPTPLDHIQIHLRGGHAIPMQQPGMTTAASRKNPFSLLVVLDSAGMAEGDVYLDDGESLTMSNYTFVNFMTAKSTITSTVTGTGYASVLPSLTSVTILGVSGSPSKATINGQPISTVSFNSTVDSLELSGFQTTLDKPFTIKWE